jgi:hypothetical protein
MFRCLLSVIAAAFLASLPMNSKQGMTLTEIEALIGEHIKPGGRSVTNTNFTTVEWTYAGQTFGITIDPGDVDDLMRQMWDAREAFLRTEPSRGRVRNDILDGLVRMVERDQHSKKETGTFLGSTLLWYACTAPEPFGSRVLQRAREGGSTITLDITRADDNGWKFRWLLDAVESTTH